MPDNIAEQFDINELNDFLILPGAETVLTEVKPTVLSSKTLEDDDLFEEKDEKKKETAEVLTDLDLNTEVKEEEVEEKKIRKNAKNPEVSGLIQQLFDDKLLVPFDDDKSLEEYSHKDFKELLEANYADREESLKVTIKSDLYESLPAQLKTVMNYLEQGGTDIQGVMAAVLRGDHLQQLDVNADSQELVRQYLKIENKKWTDDKIDSVIQGYEDIGKLETYAEIAKEKLQEVQAKEVEDALEGQKARKEEAGKIRQAFTENVYSALEKGDLNGMKIDKQTQAFLYKELTTSNYQSYTGRPTNLLGHLLEQYQFSKEPRYDLIAEATWLLSKPEEYRESIRKQITTETTKDVVRKLKTEEARTTPSTSTEEKEQGSRKLAKPRNIFARQ